MTIDKQIERYEHEINAFTMAIDKLYQLKDEAQTMVRELKKIKNNDTF